MMKRTDFWTAFFIAIHLLLIQNISGISQSLMMNNAVRSLQTSNPTFWMRMGFTSFLVFLFFNSLFKVVGLLKTSEENFPKALHRSLLALMLLLGLMFMASIFPRV